MNNRITEQTYFSFVYTGIANIVEYLPVRAYSTFKTPAPEMAPVRFNLVPQPAMVINNQQQPNVLNSTNSSSAVPSSNTSRTAANQPPQHVEFETTFNIIPPQQNISTNQSNAINVAASSSANNNNINCGIVAPDGEQYLTPSMQTLSTDTANGFNVTPNTAIQYRQTFHSNQPYTTTYSIQPTHKNSNNLPANFDIQNMFNLRNYQMNPQNYHNLMQNSRINLQEKQAILLNDFVHSFTESNPYEHTSQTQSQQQQQQQTQQTVPTSVSVDSKSTSTSMNKTMAPRTKGARKMVSEANVSVSSSMAEKTASSTKSNRVTRSSNRTTRAQNFSNEQKSPQTTHHHHKSSKNVTHTQTHQHVNHHKSSKSSSHGQTPRKTNRHK